MRDKCDWPLASKPTYSHMQTHTNMDNVLPLEKNETRLELVMCLWEFLVEVNSPIKTWELTKIMLN